MKASLIIPCYNEAANLPNLLERCSFLCASTDSEIIVVDNGSTDATSVVIAELLARYPGCRSVRVESNQGYGFGILAGLKAAQGDVLAWTHADLQTDPMDIVAGLALFQKHGTDVFVKGRRYGRPVSDVIFTIGMSVFETLLLKQRLWDINAQPTMFSRGFFNTWESPPHDFSLDLFAYALARQQGLPVHRFPVRFGERLHGHSHWNLNWRAKWKFIRRTVSYSLSLRRAWR